MGLATAKIMGRDHLVLICDVNQARLEAAGQDLAHLGVGCESMMCDISDRESVDALVKRAVALGPLASVIHTAGLSPQMADPETILKVNALGSIHITDAFYEVAAQDFALVNVASVAAYLIPVYLDPRRVYPYACSDMDVFFKKLLFRCRLMPTKFHRSALAYLVSKNFVVWYSQKRAGEFGKKGARILTVSPGPLDTEMGRLEVKSGALELVKEAAINRFGSPEEVAEILAFCASEKASYLTGTDILCDGGVMAARVS